MDKVTRAGNRSNRADTVRSVFRVTTQSPIPEQAPLQPAKVESPAGFAVNLTVFPVGKLSLQSFPQFMPLGALVTVPEPDPLFSTIRVDIGTGTTTSKTAVTD
jgi:hypothetical protein